MTHSAAENDTLQEQRVIITHCCSPYWTHSMYRAAGPQCNKPTIPTLHQPMQGCVALQLRYVCVWQRESEGERAGTGQCSITALPLLQRAASAQRAHVTDGRWNGIRDKKNQRGPSSSSSSALSAWQQGLKAHRHQHHNHHHHYDQKRAAALSPHPPETSATSTRFLPFPAFGTRRTQNCITRHDVSGAGAVTPSAVLTAPTRDVGAFTNLSVLCPASSPGGTVPHSWRNARCWRPCPKKTFLAWNDSRGGISLAGVRAGRVSGAKRAIPRSSGVRLGHSSSLCCAAGGRCNISDPVCAPVNVYVYVHECVCVCVSTSVANSPPPIPSVRLRLRFWIGVSWCSRRRSGALQPRWVWADDGTATAAAWRPSSLRQVTADARRVLPASLYKVKCQIWIKWFFYKLLWSYLHISFPIYKPRRSTKCNKREKSIISGVLMLLFLVLQKLFFLEW